ncbi:MAG: recombinase family protein [Ilumatobacteraceae bacterium]
MDEKLIGYARCSTDEQDLTAQRQALHALGVPPDRVYIDHGISGTKRERPGLDQALAAVRTGDTLVVPKLDRLARSVPDARDIGDTLAKRGVSLSLGGQIYDPDDPMGKLFFNILATFAEFEVDLIRMRTREGMAVARAQGKLKGRQPKLSAMQQRAEEDASDRRVHDFRSWRVVLGVAADGVSHHQPNKPIDRQSAGLNGVSAQTEILHRTLQVSVDNRWVTPVHRDTSAVGHGCR